MQSVNSKYYYCFQCKKTIIIKSSDLICPECNSDFLQEANISENEPNQTGISLDDFLTILPHIASNRTPELHRLIDEIRSSRTANRNIHVSIRNLIQYLNEIPLQSAASEVLTKELAVVGPDDINECKICFSSFTPGEEKNIISCSHQFHVECLAPWLKISSLCPVCKKKVS